MEEIGKTKIDIGMGGGTVTILAHVSKIEKIYEAEVDIGKQVLVEEDELKWHENEYEKSLTLEEISVQLKDLGYRRTYLIIHEMPLSGEIFKYGNYDPETWEQIGTTRGYA